MKIFSYTAQVIVSAGFLVALCASAQTTSSTNQPVSPLESKPVFKLSGGEKEMVGRFVAKRGGFPGPTTNEIMEAVEVLILQSCDKAEVQALLGSPTHPPKQEDVPSTRELWQYDVGDSQAISFVFDTKGQVSSVLGTGVGFRQLECTAGTNGVRRVVEKKQGSD